MKSTQFLQQLRQNSPREVTQALREQKRRLLQLRQDMATKRLDNPLQIRDARKAIVRIITIMHERQITPEEGHTGK